MIAVDLLDELHPAIPSILFSSADDHTARLRLGRVRRRDRWLRLLSAGHPALRQTTPGRKGDEGSSRDRRPFRDACPEKSRIRDTGFPRRTINALSDAFLWEVWTIEKSCPIPFIEPPHFRAFFFRHLPKRYTFPGRFLRIERFGDLFPSRTNRPTRRFSFIPSHLVLPPLQKFPQHIVPARANRR